MSQFPLPQFSKCDILEAKEPNGWVQELASAHCKPIIAGLINSWVKKFRFQLYKGHYFKGHQIRILLDPHYFSQIHIFNSFIATRALLYAKRRMEIAIRSSLYYLHALIKNWFYLSILLINRYGNRSPGCLWKERISSSSTTLVFNIGKIAI